VVKPIYPEDLDYDGPLTLNLRTSESCGAVQAGHTVSAVEDIAPNISEPISSSPSEILLSNPNNLVLTYPDDKLLPDNNASTSNTILARHTEIQHLHYTHSLLSTQQYGSIYPKEQEIYDEYELLPDDSDNYSSLPTNNIERTNINFHPNLLEIYEPSTCYNKFLYYHRLQSLPSPQTVGSFLTYLQEEYPMFYKKQYIRISFKESRIDYVFEEAHIYLLHEHLLPNHFFVPFEDLSFYDDVPLKSNYSSNSHSNNNNNFQLPASIDDLFDPIPSLTSSPYNSSPTTNGNPLISSNFQPTRDLHINIATHNVRGFNSASKRQIWQDYCINHDISIACITETKISHKTKLSFCNNNLYTYYWANADSSIEGAAIMIRNYLKPHVHSCLMHPGGAVALDLFFKSNIKLRVISVYLSSTDTIKRNNTQNTVINWILQARQLNIHPIILGDFNTQDNTISSSSSKYKLINFLHHTNMFDIGAHFNNTHYTWSNNLAHSRIDYIWTDSFNIQFILSYDLDNSQTSTLSDHSILFSSWTFPNAYSKPPRMHTGVSRRIFNYKSMSTDQWTEFSECITQLFLQHNIPLSVNTHENIDTTWHKIQHSILQAAIQLIPNKISRKRSYNHKYTPHCTALYTGLKKLGQLIKKIKNNPNSYLPHINSHILSINSYTKANLDPLLSLDTASTQSWLQHAYEVWKQVYHAYQLEYSLLLRQQINHASEKRCETLTSKPKQAINSILDRYQPPIHFLNIKLNNQLVTEPSLIKQHIKSHYHNWTAHRPINQYLFDNFWHQHYQPLSHINSAWYTSLTVPITEEEVLQTISKLPNGKACGPTGISYEMIKHLGSHGITTLTALFNRCLSENRIPKLWKHGRIFPIPKNNTFEGNLNLTRPISLIEHIRKLYTKILTNRLNQVFSKHTILSPYNYVALPNNSTSIPIHILNNLIEDANCNHKEIWLLSQDMSKAYDSVNFTLFKHSLTRLNLPSSIINILLDLLTDRQNQVITNLGLTAPYQVQNGIDQGETITPLLWRIYYDPLITHIHTNTPGYSIGTSWMTNLKNQTFDKIQTKCSVLAYMDDTLWIASSQTELTRMISIAESFYTMANIQVNPSKSILSTNLKVNNYTPIIFNNHALPLWPSYQPFKFLGCWFTLDNKQSKQTCLLITESSQLINIARTKKITDTQARYIINTVIIPTMEYRIQNIVINRSACNKILSHHIGLVKHKAKLSRTIPTSTLLHPQLYNIKNIWDIQLQHHISNFIKRLNDNNLLGTTTHIRIQQIQNNLWSSTSIFSHPNPTIDGPNRYTTNFKIIQLFKHLGWTINSNPNFNIPFTIKEGAISLESILSSHSKYPTFKKQIRHHHLLFLDQLTSFDNSCLLDWKHISPRLNKIPKGKIPLWFTFLEDQTTSHAYERTIYPHFNLPQTNYYSYTTGHFSKYTKPWLITLFDNQIVIGKARRQSSTSDYTLITHWQCNIQPQFTRLYPTPSIITFPCSSCSLNSNIIANKCTILIPTSHATKFFGRLNPDKSVNLNANYLDLIFSTAARNPTSIPILPNLLIPTAQIPSFFYSSPALDTLQSICHYNSHLTELTFYTDGSVIDLGNSQCSMGIGWIQLYNQNILHTFQSQIKFWPCSFKAELVAVLSAISTAPRNCSIQIFTDSQSVISKYNSLIHTMPLSKPFNIPYWPIWNTLLNFIRSYNLNITFHKVIAHQDDVFNNKADQLARCHQTAPYLLFDSQNIYNHNFTLSVDNFSIELPIRRCVRTICHAHILALWSSQNRFQQWLPISQYINWNATWLYINNNQKISNYSHSFYSSTLKSFRIKILLDDLPAPHILHRRNPSYPNTCHLCQQASEPLHWIICPTSEPLFQLIKDSLAHILSPNKLEITNLAAENLYTQIMNLNSFQIHQLPNQPSLLSTLSGLIPLDIISTLYELTTSSKSACSLTISLLLHINQQIYTNIWIPYCISRSQNQALYSQASSSLSSTFSISNSSKNIQDSHNHIFDISLQKIETWLYKWIKFSTPSSDILTYTQI